MSITDIAFVSLIIMFSVSSLCSKSFYESFIGNKGRFCGLLVFIIFFLLYLIISRNFSFKEYVFVLFASAMIIVFTLCILNSFRIDPLNIYNNYTDDIINDFTSTIGNKNVMSSLCCVTVPAFFVLFIHKKTALRLLYLSASIIGSFAMIRCDSQSGLLGFALAFVVLSLYYAGTAQKPFAKKLFIILICLYSLIFFAAVSLFIYFTFVNSTAELKGFMKFFRFNDRWGTHRGYMWRKSFEVFKNGNLLNKLFGCGPDTFYNAFEPFFSELHARFGDTTNNSAHNEFLNYLITTGLLGLASYLTLVISAIVRAMKAARKNYLALVFISPVICYFLQSIVNVSTIIVLPLFFIFIALAENISKNELNAS